jgi:excisionase family DNA binding protein
VTRPLTVSEVAERWQCSDRTVYQLIEAGALRSFGVGRLIRVRPEWIEEFECGHEQACSEEEKALQLIRERRQRSERPSATSRRIRTRLTLVTGTGKGQGTH